MLASSSLGKKKKCGKFHIWVGWLVQEWNKIHKKTRKDMHLTFILDNFKSF